MKSLIAMASSLIFVLVLISFLFLHSFFGEVWERAEIEAGVHFPALTTHLQYAATVLLQLSATA